MPSSVYLNTLFLLFSLRPIMKYIILVFPPLRPAEKKAPPGIGVAFQKLDKIFIVFCPPLFCDNFHTIKNAAENGVFDQLIFPFPYVPTSRGRPR
jgi:hypothetical protein